MDDPLPNRRSVRIPGFSYRSNGAYYITIGAFDRGHIFGQVVDGICRHSTIGTVVNHIWNRLADRWQGVTLDEYSVLMPNHFHGIIWIDDSVSAKIPRIGDIVGSFKSDATKMARRAVGDPQLELWQRSYMIMLCAMRTI